MRRFFKWLGVLMLSVLAINTIAIAYFTLSRKPKARALTALEPTDLVEITTDSWTVFSPRQVTPITGLIFYPGTFVDPKAYAEPAQAIAEKGYLVILVPVPLGIASLAPDRAADVQAAFPEIQKWVVAGHSQGGSVAIRYVADHPEDVDGLMLWAGKPIGKDDLSGYDLPVLSINGTLDPRRSPEILAEISNRLPMDAEQINIEGGTHEYFGDYAGELEGEEFNGAVAHDMQTSIVVEAAVRFLETVTNGS